jgi:hypothetical protein
MQAVGCAVSQIDGRANCGVCWRARICPRPLKIRLTGLFRVAELRILPLAAEGPVGKSNFSGSSRPRVSRALFVLPAALFAFLGLKYFGDPVGTTAADSISLASPAAITDMRVVGSIFLACGLISSGRLRSRGCTV